MKRRNFIQAGVLLPAAVVAPTLAQVPAPPPGATPAAAAPPPVTHQLARYVATAPLSQVPPSVRKEAIRTLVNYLGAALGGSREPATQAAVRALDPLSGPRRATLIGRRERLDVLNAAFVNGVASHVLDFDDTHLKTIIHPGGPVLSAILALAEQQRVSGADFLNALVLGIETECRLGNAVYPQHYDVGWHITGTAGVFGAAAAAGRLLGLDEQRMCWAIGLAASQPVGLRESFGSMNKSFNPGRAAQNGLTAALLAQAGFDSSEQMLEAPRGWGRVVSTKQDWNEVLGGLGTRYETALNTYKPFACGIVLHPIIDGCIQLRDANQLTAAQIARVELRVNPLVLELTGKTAPTTGLEGKFSVYHAAAVAIVSGAAGEQQFSDPAVRDPAVIALRQKVKITVDPAVHEAQAGIVIVLNDGRRLEKFIEHAVGSLEVPMSDMALEKKVMGLADGVLAAARTRALLDLAWKLESLPEVAVLARAAAAG